MLTAGGGDRRLLGGPSRLSGEGAWVRSQPGDYSRQVQETTGEFCIHSATPAEEYPGPVRDYLAAGVDDEGVQLISGDRRGREFFM